MRNLILVFLLFTISSSITFSKIWNVGADRDYKFCSEVSNLVGDGDTVLIDPGLYENDIQVTWRANNLLIRGNSLPELRASDKILSDHSNGKGIFVIKGTDNIVEGIKFTNSKVVDHNGAGIRQEGRNLLLTHCIFDGNENGILCGKIDSCKIIIEHCQFLKSGSSANPGYQHNIYIGHIDTLIFRYNLTQEAVAEGHELKSRAYNNFILYNRIANLTTVDSRNIDLPNGGTAVILGNIIEQGQNSANSGILGFGLEGLSNPGPHNLYICSNTIVNKMNKGNFFNVAAIDTFILKNNICVGKMTGGFLLGTPAFLDSSNNIIDDDINYPKFEDVQNSDYNLTWDSPACDKGVIGIQTNQGFSLLPKFVYKDVADFEERFEDYGDGYHSLDIGAFEHVWIGNVKENQNLNYLTLFPNPSSEYLTLKKSSDFDFNNDIQIFNSIGIRQNLKIVSQNPLKINISNFLPGIYFISIGDKKSKFIKL